MFWFVYIFLIGLVIGSFANVVIWRAPRGESIRGRSRCVNCLSRIAWYDLIPIASFFILRGRCRQCGRGIRWQYPLVELFSGLIFAISFAVFSQYGLIYWLFILFLLELLLILGITDFNNLILPDALIGLMASGTGIFMIYQKFAANTGYGIYNTSLIDNLLSAAVLFVILFIPWLISGGRWLGLGDAKLMGAIGLAFGFVGAVSILYGGVVMGAIVGLFMWLSRRATLKSKLPLGTFVCIASIFYVFAASWINPLIIKWLWTVFPTFFASD